MAVSTNICDHTTATIVAPGTSVGPALAVPDNCYAILIHNLTGDVLYVGNGAAGGALTAANATVIPAASAPTFPIGTQSKRPGPANFIYDAVVAGVVNLTYFNSVET